LRVDGVQQVRESKYIMLHAPRSALPEIRRLLPGLGVPDHHSAGGLRRPRRRARGLLSRRTSFGRTLESLKAGGRRGGALLVLPVEKMLA